ncbi:helix-turn-helix transcriptional regulator [Phaeobacter gallaeciensis]|uniref:Helix-turn-helix transcriptional regulator n=2 Tax=Roseobacteraceae TaxID=2854170 RepID=A0A366X3P1_9RHOB|nr:MULTISPECIES: helix-turn-helix transcriptional regulator [Roseobacteraceae]MBT3139539.1 helix-turn-helix transcriptional regulator [Falsiruegeria litorea]MBT8170042.1 helix-turn-helix transcriptional regulator [Falsiruegeria litorea]RBW58599.1 helix-turn-helix transcriptional regulator [Phaeobacter gallaeciensis]
MSDLAFEYAPVGLVELENRIIRRCNLQFAQTFGGHESDYRDMPLLHLYPSHAEFERIGARGLAAMQDTGYYNDERIMRRRNGDLFWCRARGKSLTPDDPFLHGIWSFSDISEDRPLVELTPRERDVAILTCRGLSAKEVGGELGLSYRTIEAHRARLLEKFGARKLPELVAKLSGMPL